MKYSGIRLKNAGDGTLSFECSSHLRGKEAAMMMPPNEPRGPEWTGYFGVELRNKGTSHWYHTPIHRDLRGEQDVRDVMETDIPQVVDYALKTLRESATPEPVPPVSEVIALTFMERIG